MYKKVIKDLYYRVWKLPQLRYWHHQRINKISNRGKANVVFLCLNLAMWRCEGILRLMMADTRFHCHVIFGTFINYPLEDTRKNYDVLAVHFKSLDISLIDSTTSEGMAEALQYMQQADIIFYPQPYGKLFGNKLDNKYYRDRLLCYIPYAFFTVSADWTCNTALHNQAWRLYRESEYHLREAKRMAHNRGENVVVVGNVKADEFANPASSEDVWKKQDKMKKRLIWAPHFSVEKGTAMSRNGFLWLSDVMPALAKKYADRLQIAFKPHPKLYSTLCQIEGWGTERTKEYYNQWDVMENGQYESGDYVSLFIHSDAIVHDSGSFTVDYLFTGKPCMFVSNDIEDTRSRLNDYAAKSLDQYYIGRCPDDVSRFIEDVVIAGNDPLKTNREAYRRQILLPQSKNQSVSKAIYNDIVQSVFL